MLPTKRQVALEAGCLQPCEAPSSKELPWLAASYELAFLHMGGNFA